MKNILLIGSEGYIGNIVTQNLLKNGFIVTSFDGFLYHNHQCVLNKIQSKKFLFNYGDILDNERLEPLIERADAVVLLAGLVGDPITKKYPIESALINDKGVKNVIDLCAKYNISRFVFISTCSNYGFMENDKLANENHELKPMSLYAKSKVNAEKYILSLKDQTDMNPIILRFATAFGLSPRMRFDLTVSEFTRDIAMGNELLVYDAHTWRPYCHVQDFARLIQMVIEAPKEKVSWEIFNSGGDINNATKQMIVDYIIAIYPNGKIRYQDHGNDPRNYRVSFEKVKSTIGFEPKYTIRDGVEELVDAINNHVFDNVDENRNFYGNYAINYPIPS